MMTPEEQAYVKKLEAKIEQFTAIIEKQAARIAELERRLNLNSTNSSKPPSTDGLKKKSRSLRTPSGKSVGAQKGHNGTTLNLPCSPTETIHCHPNECRQCTCLGQCQGKKVESRYLIDAKITVSVYEYMQMEYLCPKSNNLLRGEFPENITATKQYGNGIRGLITALNTECALAINKIHHLLKPLLNVPVSTGFIHSVVKAFAVICEPAKDSIIARLDDSYVINSDETGVRTECGTAWAHSASNELFTYQYVSRKRGKAGMEEAGVLPNYTGILVHDCWRPYWAFPASQHGLCLAHILRELKGIVDNDTKQDWAEWFMDLIREMKAVKDRLINEGKEYASDYYKNKFKRRWQANIFRGKGLNPLRQNAKGRWIKNKARCLIDRLEKYEEELMLFFHDFRVPFDNNQAERDVRQFKIKVKIAGCFRTLEGAQDYAKINSVLSTIKKHGLNVYESVVAMLDRPGYIPWEPAGE